MSSGFGIQARALFVAKKYSDQELSIWADCLVEYAEDWDAHFGKFFTQEFWYILVPVTVGYWNKTPLTVGAVKEQMKGLAGSDDRTKDLRIGAAIQAGFLTKCSFANLDKSLQERIEDTDGRLRYLLPTRMLQTKMHQHLSTTLSSVREALAAVGSDGSGSD
jgi:hypothetical protein